MTTITAIFKPDKCVPTSRVAHSFHTTVVTGTRQDPKTGEEIEIKENRHIELVPGVNYLPQEKFALLESHPDYPQYEKWGAIVLFTPQVEELAAEAEDSNDLSGYSGDDAQEIIAAQDDVDILKAWLKAEKRKTVQRAINARITQIESGNQ